MSIAFNLKFFLSWLHTLKNDWKLFVRIFVATFFYNNQMKEKNYKELNVMKL